MVSINNPFRHYGCRINDEVTWAGKNAIIMQNELLQIIILVEKGAEIVQFLYKPLDIDFLWHSENTYKDPAKFITTDGRSPSSFFDNWTGGWFEVLPNGGPGCTYKGAYLGQFAEIINIPWKYKILVDTKDNVKIELWVQTYRTPFMIKKTLELKSNVAALYIEEEIQNIGNEVVDFMWGHHPVIGAPFLDENCKLFAPPSRVEVLDAEDGPDHRLGLFQEGEWPILLDRQGKTIDLENIPNFDSKSMDNFYIKEFTEGWIAVAKDGIGFGLAWDPDVFRYIWVWQAFGGGLGYPWYGRTYNMGIEPWTSYPCVGLEESIKKGTALNLQPNEKLTSWLTATAFVDKREVKRILRSGQVI